MSRYVIDKTALIENVHYLQKKAGVPIIGVVKGNGYGFGLTELALILEHCGITTLAVTEVTDIDPLRAVLQPNTDILVMRSTCVDSEARHIADTGCIATIGSTRAAQAMQAAAADLGVKVPCHLKIDTGMGRYGFLPAQVAEAIACYDLPNLEFTGAYTHFSSAFHDKAKTIAQLEVFKDTLAQIEKAGKTVGTRHAANSPALLNVEHVALDAVRIGSAFTGRVFTHSETPLHRLGRLEAEVVDMKEVPAGYAVGYNGTFVTKRPTTIAIVPMGHYDGFGLTKEKENHNFHSVLSALKQFLKKAHLTVTINGEEYKIELDIQDNQSSTDKAVSAAQQLVADKVSVVLGSYGSGVSIAAGTYFANAKIPAIGCSCTNAAVTAGNDYYFRVCFLDPFQGSVMASFAMEEFGAKKAYVLSMLGDDYTVGLAKNFVIAFEAAGGEIVADETFVEGTADFSAYLNNAVAGGADVIFAPSAIAYAPQIIEQASALGISLPILGGDTWENSAISDAQNGTDMQVFVSTFFDENDESGLAKEFVTGYKAWLNGNSQNLTNNGGNDVVAAVSALGYDAYMTAVAAIEKAQSTDGFAIRDALAGLSIDAVTGSISFDANGDAIKSTAYIKQAIDGGFQFYKVQNAD